MPLQVRTAAAAFVTLCALQFALAGAGRADAVSEESAETIEQLLKSGWQIAGYTSTFDNRSSLILFKHPAETYLVQCLTGYDVTRSPRVYQNCYRLK
jgi:hypothetical protein